MRTRSTSATNKTAAAAKKTQTTPSPVGKATPNAVEPKRGSAGRSKHVSVTPDSKAQPSVEQTEGPGEASQLTPVAKSVSGTRIVKKVVKKVVKKTPVSQRATKSREFEKAKVEETAKENIVEDSKDADSVDNKPLPEIVGGSLMEDENAGNPEKSSKKEERETCEPEKNSMGSGEDLSEAMEPMATDTESMDGQTPSMENPKDELEEKMEDQNKVKQADGLGEASQVTPVSKSVSGTRLVKRVVKRVVKKTPVSERTTKPEEFEKAKVEETKKENIVEHSKDADAVDNKPLLAIVGGSLMVDETAGNSEKSSEKEEGETGEPEEHSMGSGEELSEAMEPMTTNTKSMDGQTSSMEIQKDEPEEKMEEQNIAKPAEGPGESSQLTPVAKPVSGTRIVKKVIKRVVKKTPVSGGTTKSGEFEKVRIEETTKENIVEDSKNADVVDNKPLTENVEGSLMEDKNIVIGIPEISSKTEEGKTGEPEEHSMGSGEELSEDMEPMATDTKSMDGQTPVTENQKDELEEKMEEQNESNDKGDPINVTIGMEDNDSDMVKRRDASLEEAGDEKIEGLSDQEVHEEFGGEDFVDDDVPGNEAETETFEEERDQFNAAARERKVRKEREIFVGGLDRDAVEEDIRRVFEYAGEVVKVRMHVDPLKKNKGYAFVQFATKEQASHALLEMKNPVIHGKRCGTAPSEDNDTLFLGNICNTWTKEAIKRKLKDYGVEGVENINLVTDPRYEGLSRGFAFVEFSSHAEAMLAYKRLQKPDVVFGHSERTAKVAFAEPLREPDPEVMAQVKSVFVDGVPPHWDEDHVREKFKIFGEIARIMLARNMSTARRKDFGFVDFTTHEAAVSCVEGVNNNGFNDGNTKVKVRVRLSNPSPKMQAVKGGMCGGFRIGNSTSGTFPRSFGRGFGRGRPPLHRANFQYGRGFYPRGPGHGGRTGFPNEREFNEPYHSFHRRQNFGRGERWGFRGAHQGPIARPYGDSVRRDTANRGYGDYDSYRTEPYSFEAGYGRSFMGRHFDGPYPYDDVAQHGMKRPYYMMDHDHDLAEPSRHRPRLNHSDPAVPIHGSRYQDDLGADGGVYSRSYYGSDYGGGAYSPFYGGDHAYGRGYYY